MHSVIGSMAIFAYRSVYRLSKSVIIMFCVVTEERV